jgi:hypothetical protein
MRQAAEAAEAAASASDGGGGGGSLSSGFAGSGAERVRVSGWREVGEGGSDASGLRMRQSLRCGCRGLIWVGEAVGRGCARRWGWGKRV